MKFLALVGIIVLVWLVGLFAFAERVRAAGNTDNGDQKGAPGAAAAAKSEEAK